MPIKNHKTGIYSIVNLVNNKMYIGQSIRLTIRWRDHKHELKNKKHYNIHLQRAWNKYGEEKFKFVILEECSKDLLNQRECYWIGYCKSDNLKYGYNIADGGNVPPNHTGKKRRQETIEKLRIASGSRKHTEETKKKMSKSRMGKKPWNAGKTGVFSEETLLKKRELMLGTKRKPHSDETKKKMSNAHKGKTFSEETRKKIGKASIGRIPPNKGIPCPDHVKKAVSEANKIKMKEYRKTHPPANKIHITKEMIKDKQSGMRRKDFVEKYKSKQVWVNLKKLYG